MSVTIYTTTTCPYCIMAKALLNKKQVVFDEINLNLHPEKRAEMVEKAEGRTSVPQIFIGRNHIGGCDDLHALEAKGKLDALLAVA